VIVTGWPTSIVVAEGVAVSARSAVAGGAELTWIAVLVLLFAGTGSDSFAATLALIVSVPVADGVNVMVRDAVAPDASVPIVHVTWPDPVAHPAGTPEAGAEVGWVIVSVTPVAASGPLFAVA
jgi:hypothetical protein